ncbi:hypothetical protein H632_c3145p0 [Helicosporidium sp. ATCC 50920]|nr:hypothetical protein H632_c3145p0 [Helicosporidium sp. ATCC 50920]|eukprot:KDD72596.1 hypothetical protein H632_c3145p0 [Helicosporidium sp. ATCC 50920]
MVGQRVKIKDKDGVMQLRESYSGRYCPRCKDQKLKGGCCVNRGYHAAYNMCSLTDCSLASPPLELSEGSPSEVLHCFFPGRVPAAIVRMASSHEYCWI